MSAAPVLSLPVVRDPGPAPVVAAGPVHLRPFRLADADAVANSLSDQAAARMLLGVPAPYLRQDALDWLMLATSGLLPGWRLAVTMADDVTIGAVNILPKAGHWTLDYWLSRFYWRRGLARQAVSAALDRFFQRMPEAEILTLTPADDAAALRLQAGLGFTVTGCREAFVEARGRMVLMIEARVDAAALRRV
ncbi:hypothetical protein BJF92_19525 [Rhizobium rhizosphaerae]|uniref:N-acetyltransferase domain-containing protein n=1 Tax=Xaviernesmea rhizosphaerae TaxID=1672749 RepID=A0A1Q9AL09_9HYPH|nr:GNAT family N-acetyltransferase [Xaviernesmea rhizosphaerae]OLP56021.1 hypothetical protein BJF92_19525 [Xaviernesmea rhizosphaerae]